MYISYNRLKELIDFDYSPSELDAILTMLGIEVEGINNFAEKYNNFQIGYVESKEKHPQADKLSICKVNWGEDKYDTVICGAPNVEQGQKIVFASLGAVVPAGEFKIEKRKIRGVESQGMICSQNELALGEDKSGIWVLPEDAPVGMPIAEYLKINDTIMEISVTPNRPDCLSHYGLAREIAAYKGVKFDKPEIGLSLENKNSGLEVQVEIESPELCPKYAGIIIKNAKISESPEWLKNKLNMLGLRPINCVVDATNYVMYETGQPLHAFDMDKISGYKIIIKTAGDGEKFTTLDSKERELNSEMLMICDAEKSIAIAGVMGGENSEITNETQNIFIESAYFDPASVRKTGKVLGLASDASYRFERGVDYKNIEYSALYAAKIIAECTGGAIMPILQINEPKEYEAQIIMLRYKRAEEIIGVKLTKDVILNMLTSLEFEIKNSSDENCTVIVPSHRVDICLEIDLIEEIARLYNYDNIQPQYCTKLNFDFSSLHESLRTPSLRAEIRDYFVQNGFNEILTQNIIDPASAKLFTENPVTIANPLGEEMSVMRPSLITSMLKTIERNLRLGNSNLRLFEVGKCFNPANLADKSFIPGIKESEQLTIAICGNAHPFNWTDKARKADFYDIKGIMEDFIEKFNFLNVKMQHDEYLSQIFSANALTLIYKGFEMGKFGEVSAKLLKKMDISADVFLITINLEKLYTVKTRDIRYSPISPFPTVKRDLGFVLDKSVNAGAVRDYIQKAGGEYLKTVEIFDVFEHEKLGKDKKNIAYSLVYSSQSRTLTDEDVEVSIARITAGVETEFKGQLREF